MGSSPGDILGLGKFTRVDVDTSGVLNLSAGISQFKLVAAANANVDQIHRGDRDGAIIILCGPTSNTVTVRDNQSGTNIHLANGSTSRALSIRDTLVLRYEDGFWVEMAFTNAD